MTLVEGAQQRVIEGKKYQRKDGQDFRAGEWYRTPEGRLFFCLDNEKLPRFLSSFDNQPPRRVLGHGTMEVIDLLEVS